MARRWRAEPDPGIVATGVYSWESQASQFPVHGPAGREHRVEFSQGKPINCYLIRDGLGDLVAIGYHYPQDMGVLEKAGNVNIWVRPDRQRQGLGTELIAWIMDDRDGINFKQQRYSQAGAALVNKHTYR